jgi:hypothetical protein
MGQEKDEFQKKVYQCKEWKFDIWTIGKESYRYCNYLSLYTAALSDMRSRPYQWRTKRLMDWAPIQVATLDAQGGCPSL